MPGKGRPSKGHRNQPKTSAQRPAGPAQQQHKSRKPNLFNVITILIALISAGFAAATYFDQHQAYEANDAATVQHYASQVSYWLQGVPNSSIPDLVIDNRSGGPIRGLTLKFPQPVKGCSKNCQWEAFDYFTLADIPPCSMLTTTSARDFSSPSIGPMALNGSILDFTDQNGVSWALKGGYGQLSELTGYKQPAGFRWGSSVTYKPAQDCS
jgi:hypothetical protein